jgi:chromosome segregation ATPase
MAKNDNVIFWVIGIIIVVAFLWRGGYLNQLFATYYSPACDFITNAEGDYASGTWISVDINKDGTLEGFGYSTSTSRTYRVADFLVFTPEGYGVYDDPVSTSRIYVTLFAVTDSTINQVGSGKIYISSLGSAAELTCPSQEPTNECTLGETSCESNQLVECVNNEWANPNPKALNVCGVECLTNLDCGRFESCVSDKCIVEQDNINDWVVSQTDLNTISISELTSRINSLQLTATQQGTLITQIQSQLTLSTNQLSFLISGLQTTATAQGQLISELQLTTTNQASLISQLQTDVTNQAILISNLQLTDSQLASLISNLRTDLTSQGQLISALQLTTTQQGGLISNLQIQLNLKTSDLQTLINELDLTATEQGQLISQLQLTTSQLTTLIQGLQTTTTGQADLISGLRTDVNTQAALISTLQTTATGQGQLISAMQTDLNNKANLIESLDLTTQENIQLINAMDLSISDLITLVSEMQENVDELKLQLNITQSDIENIKYQLNQSSNQDEIVCAADTKLCSDGSYVSRVSPSCEFAECLGFNWNDFFSKNKLWLIIGGIILIFVILLIPRK